MLRVQIRIFWHRLPKWDNAQGRGVFLTSHALADIDELCDRMAILHAGRMVFVGTPAECRQRHGGGPQASLEQAFLNCITA